MGRFKIEGGLRGKRKIFPLRLRRLEGLGHIDYICDTPEAFIEVLSGEMDKEINEKKKLVQLCEELGLYDTISLFDFRTFQLLRLYNFYKYSPQAIDNSVFFEAVNILSQYEQRLI